MEFVGRLAESRKREEFERDFFDHVRPGSIRKRLRLLPVHTVSHQRSSIESGWRGSQVYRLTTASLKGFRGAESPRSLRRNPSRAEKRVIIELL